MTTPPFSQEAEDHAVGACMVSQTALERVAEILRPEHLYMRRRIYQAVLEVHERGDPADPILVAEVLNRAGAHNDVQTMRDLVNLQPTAGNAEHFARVCIDYATRRQLVTVGQEIARSGWEPTGEIAEELDKAEQLVYDLTTQQQTGELEHVSAGLAHTFDQLARPGGEVTGTATGLTDLDKLTAGYQPGQLVVVAARPSMGKSALIINQAVHVAVTLGKPVALFTLEMSREEINQRALAQIADVNLHKIRTRVGLSLTDRQRLDRAGETLQQAPLYIDDTPSARLTEIRSRTRRLKAKQPDLALVCVDYLQLMLGTGDEQNRNLEIAGISRGLKVIARELAVPVVALSQLSRALEYRADKRPMLADLRDSGAIEQDADLVVFIYRDGYYTKEDDTTAELILAKHRNGPTGVPVVQWKKDTAEFRNLATVA